MKQEIESSINELKEYVDKQREQILGIINAIENEDFVPTESQKVTLEYISERCEWGLNEIKRLEELIKKIQ